MSDRQASRFRDVWCGVFDPSPPMWARGPVLLVVGLMLTLAANAPKDVSVTWQRMNYHYLTPDGHVVRSEPLEVVPDGWSLYQQFWTNVNYQRRDAWSTIRTGASGMMSSLPAAEIDHDQVRSLRADTIRQVEDVPAFVRTRAARMVDDRQLESRFLTPFGGLILAAGLMGPALMMAGLILSAGRIGTRSWCVVMVRRLSQGLCPRCRYELAPEDIPCPECGRDYREGRRFALDRLDRRRRIRER